MPVGRYFDPEFQALERQRLWPRVWQMACRLEEIPKPGDYVVYDLFDQSVIITRVDAGTVKAYHNACRHRGMQLVQDRGSSPQGFTCPFHGWEWRVDGRCKFVYSASAFAVGQLQPTDLALRECRVETWGGCAFVNFDERAPALRDAIEPFATMHDAWNVQALRTEWWHAARLPVNWKLAMEAFMESYHVMATHPQLLPPGATQGSGSLYTPVPAQLSPMSRTQTLPTAAPPGQVASRDFIEMNIKFMRVISEGMAGMIHAKDVAVAESLRDVELPADPAGATIAWRRSLNDAVTADHRRQGLDFPDLNEIDAQGFGTSINFCFPNFFMLPTFGSATSYRIRPIAPEECLFEIWSLTRFPEGVEPPPVKTPTPMAFDDPRWPTIPRQDFANLPRQQRGLHARGFDYMRLSHQGEGLISNYQRLIDGYLAAVEDERLLAAARKVSGPIDVPIADLEL